MPTKRTLLLFLALATLGVLWWHAAVSNILLTSAGEVDGQVRGMTPAPQPRALARLGVGLVLLACAGTWWRARAARDASKR